LFAFLLFRRRLLQKLTLPLLALVFGISLADGSPQAFLALPTILSFQLGQPSAFSKITAFAM
jgi:hypothetical protein